MRVATARPPFRSNGLKPVSDVGSIVGQLYPDARITSLHRDPNSALGRANPNSWHNKSNAAVDVAPIPGMTYDQYIQGFQRNGYGIIEARDEQANPLPWTTGPNWHVVLGQ